MSFDEPGKFFDGRPGDSFTPGALRASSEARSAESHARHERWQQEKAIRLAEEADTRSKTELAAMAKNDARAFALAVAQFRSMMEICFPDLVALTTQQQIPKSSSLFPVAACLGSHGPCWMHPIPEGDKDGDALVWSKDDHAWLPGGVAGAYNGEFALSIIENGGTPKLHVADGGIYVDDDWYNVGPKDFDLAEETVYLVIKKSTGNSSNPYEVTLETSQYPSKAYIKIGSCAPDGDSWIITQKYLGGSGLAFGFGNLPKGSAAGQVLAWDNTEQEWKPDWVRAIP